MGEDGSKRVLKVESEEEKYGGRGGKVWGSNEQDKRAIPTKLRVSIIKWPKAYNILYYTKLFFLK